VLARLPGAPLREGPDAAPLPDELVAEILASSSSKPTRMLPPADLAARDFAGWQEKVVFDGWPTGGTPPTWWPRR